MTADEMAVVHAQLCGLAEAALHIEGLDAFVEAVGGAPALEASELRELALAAAAFQHIALRQLGHVAA